MNAIDTFAYTREMRRSDKTMVKVKRQIALLIRKYKSDGRNLLEIGVNHGTQTLVYHSQFNNPGEMHGLDWEDRLSNVAKEKVSFHKINIENEKLPPQDGNYDVVVCNQVFEHIKNIYTPISEIWRVLRPDGLLCFSVPNLSCWHNCLLLAFGQQPTTININSSHVRGFSVWSMSRFPETNGLFKIIDLKGVGYPPFFTLTMGGPIITYCHTPVWALRKKSKRGLNWEELRRQEPTTTSFFSDI